jgi:uncharacterized NAD-dependent epimerase/dehydratase family protein
MMILVHHAGRTQYRFDPPHPLAPLRAQWAAYEAVAALLHPARIVGVALNAHGVSESVARQEASQIRDEFHVPVVDPFAEGCDALISTVCEQ